MIFVLCAADGSVGFGETVSEALDSWAEVSGNDPVDFADELTMYDGGAGYSGRVVEVVDFPDYPTED